MGDGHRLPKERRKERKPNGLSSQHEIRLVHRLSVFSFPFNVPLRPGAPSFTPASLARLGFKRLTFRWPPSRVCP